MPKEPITTELAASPLWITRCPVPTASSVAFDRGLLTEGLDEFDFSVQSLQDSPDAGVRNAHFHHELDGLIREGGNIPALWARSNGADTRLVALTWVDEYQAILTRDPEIGGPEDLAGRRVGIPRHPDSVIDFWAGMALRGLHSSLGLAGLGLADVEAVDLVTTSNPTGWGPGDRAPKGVWDLELDALESGKVDAVYVKGSPGIEASRRPGIHEVVEIGSHPDPVVRVNNGNPRTVTVNAELLEVPGLVPEILASLLEASDWATANEDEMARVLAAETGGNVDEVRAAYGAASLHPDIRPDWLDALEVERRFLASQGLLGDDFEIDRWLDPAPLAEAKQLVIARRIDAHRTNEETRSINNV